MNELEQQSAQHECQPHEPLYMECACYSPEHALTFSWDDEDNTIYSSVFLNQYHNIFRRIIVALKYVFGYKCKYGHFDCFIMQPKDYSRFLRLLTVVSSRHAGESK